MSAVAVSFPATWLTDPTTPAVSLQLFKVARVEQDTAAGQVQVYAGGRRRIISTPGDVRQSALTFQRVSAADLETLRSWRGRVLLLRDYQGWRRWGTFFDVQVTAFYRGPVEQQVHQVAVTWTDVDYTEGV